MLSGAQFNGYGDYLECCAASAEAQTEIENGQQK